MTQPARGERNNNPGNIEAGADWQGLMAPENMTPAQRKEDRFAVFEHPKWGVRAIARVLITYQDRRRAADGSRIDTVQEIIDRWAPPAENNTSAYVRAVRTAMGRDGDEVVTVDVHDYDQIEPLVKAIIHHELGYQPYPDRVIDEGLRLAGIVRRDEVRADPAPAPEVSTRRQSLNESKTMKTGAVGGVVGGVTAVGSVAAEVAPALGPIRTVASFVRDNPILCVGLLGAALFVVAFVVMRRRIADWQDGKR